MAKFHVNSRGYVTPCKALFKKCPYDKHFNSMEEAQEYLDELHSKSVAIEQEREERWNQKADTKREYSSFAAETERYIIKPKKESSQEYRELFDKLTENTYEGSIFIPKPRENFGKNSIFNKMKNKENYLINDVNYLEAEVLKDISELYSTHNMWSDLYDYEKTHYDKTLMNTLTKTHDMYQAYKLTGIKPANQDDRIHFYDVANTDSRHELSLKTKLDKDGNISNVYFLGVEETENFIQEPTKVYKVEDGYIYTENNPEGIPLDLTIDLETQGIYSKRGIFIIDENDTNSVNEFPMEKRNAWVRTTKKVSLSEWHNNRDVGKYFVTSNISRETSVPFSKLR